jgi:dTDP-4-amino-4,6-dideoxygalactose transaminase
MNNSFLPFALPEIGPEEIAEVVNTLETGWLTTGPKTKIFEENFSNFIGAKHALAVNSATAGLHLALEAIGIKEGDKVITTPYTFTSTAEVIRYLGADPIFVDIDAKTFNLDMEKLELHCNSDFAKAIIPVHFAGQACDMDKILSIAKQKNMKVIEDAAHALPTTYKGKMIGTMGDLTVYSFYATKTITTGEGGMVVTNNDKYVDRIKTMRLHGISRDVFDRYQSSKPSWYYEVVAPGYKYNMTDIAASIGIHQLKKANVFQERRKLIAEKYTEAFDGLPLVTPYVSGPDVIHSWHLYVIQLKLDELKIIREQFIELMADKNIGTSVHFIPLHIQPYWRDRYGFKPEDFPVAFEVYQRAVSLPIYPKMTDQDVERVIDAVTTILEKYSK